MRATHPHDISYVYVYLASGSIFTDAGAAARPHSSRPLQAHRRCAQLWYNTAIQKNAPRSGATPQDIAYGRKNVRRT